MMRLTGPGTNKRRSGPGTTATALNCQSCNLQNNGGIFGFYANLTELDKSQCWQSSPNPIANSYADRDHRSRLLASAHFLPNSQQKRTCQDTLLDLQINHFQLAWPDSLLSPLVPFPSQQPIGDPSHGLFGCCCVVSANNARSSLALSCRWPGPAC